MAAKKVDFNELLKEFESDEDYKGQIEHREFFPARMAKYAPLDPPLPDQIAGNLKKLGIPRLYTHQAEAISLVREGKDVVVVTETASGKSLCYHLPVLETIHKFPGARALYLFPTKALAQDQGRALHKILAPDENYDETQCFHRLKLGHGTAAFGTYDGDTPKDARSAIRRSSNIILTNPDMLSLGILPNHSLYWTGFFSNLKYIIIDEIHVYRGVFGSHVANVMRRIERVCAKYGARPQFICCSATTANPAEHAAMLLNREPVTVTSSGAPSSKKTFVLWNPPIFDVVSGLRVSSLAESVKLFSRFIELGLRTIVFARAKPTVEVILRFTRDRLKDNPDVFSRITSYRGGYLPEDRRQIEKALSAGELIGVTCTNALELGVDIGSLDAAVINGYPGTIASTWQQAGRAGRRERESIAILVASSEPLDQYLMRNPDYFFNQNVEHAIINPFNPYILAAHLKAAAFELPLEHGEEKLFGPNYMDTLKGLVKDGELKESRGRIVCIPKEFPAEDINLRTSTAKRYAIVDHTGRQIGMMDSGTVFNYLHDGAVYLHQGESYLVTKLDTENKVAFVEKKILPYYTRSLSREDVTIESQVSEKQLFNTPVHFGYVNVTGQIHSYKKIRTGTDEVIERVPLDYPIETLRTQSLWFIIGQKLLTGIDKRGLDVQGGLHAVEHAAIGMLPFLAMCDRDDIGGLSTIEHPDTEQPTIFIHDGHPGGIGLSEMGYHAIEELLRRALELIGGCKCQEGCPSCIQSPKCGNMNEPLDKEAALLILKGILKKK